MSNWFRKNPSLSFAIVALGLIGVFFAINRYQEKQLTKAVFEPLAPSKITFIGLASDQFKVLLINNQPYLIQQTEYEKFQRGDPSQTPSQKKRIPIDSLLLAINGDPKGLGDLIAVMNEENERGEKDYRSITIDVPVTYNVIGKERTINAQVTLQMSSDNEIFKNEESKARWVEFQKKKLPETVMPLLTFCEVIITEKQIERGWVTETNAPPPLSGKFYELHFNLNEEGRKRIAKQTGNHIGEQIIVVADGIPVAAPLIQQTIDNNRIDIPNLRSDDLIVQLLDTLKSLNIPATAP